VEERTVAANYPGGPGEPQVTGGPAYDQTQIMNAPVPTAALPYDRTMQAMTQPCPVCGTPNGPSERYCQDCGLMFGSTAEVVEPLPDMAQSPRLVAMADGKEFALNPGANSVGRDAADILIVDPTVSRRHAQVILDGGRLLVEDFGSTNGTKVGDRRLAAGEQVPAGNGDTIRFGNVHLTVNLPGSEANNATVAMTDVGADPAAAPLAAFAPAAEAAEIVDRGEPVAMAVMVDAGGEFPLYAGVNTLGRRSGNQIVVSDAFMSGRHAEIHVMENGVTTLVDVGSTNGTFVGGERLAANEPTTLSEGGEFTLGKTKFVLRGIGGETGGEEGTPAPAAETAATHEGESEPGVEDFVLPDDSVASGGLSVGNGEAAV
jgi:pSer/pThr/pTyr-binding forkhead associated (FHA) protein